MSKKQVVNSKMSIKVQFEIGHTAALKTKKGADNFTHDWELYVKGVDKTEINSYIEKIVFNLHESFPKPKRTFKEPPYVLKESGYAGFILPIDIHFKNRTMQTYQYDIDLQPSGPPVHKCEIKKHIFENPTEDFRQKLLKGGGTLVGNSDEDRNRNSETDFQHKIKNSSSNSGNVTVAYDSLKKSHKIRPEKTKIQNFENIFGKPIQKTAATPPSTNNASSNTNLLKTSSSQDQKIKPSNPNITQIGTNSSKLSNQNKSDKVVSNQNLLNIKEKSEIVEKSDKKEKHKHSSHKDKEKSSKDGKDRKEDKHERREDRDRKKDKSHSKERDRSSDKSIKNRTESPQRKKQRTSSPATALTNIHRKSPPRSSSSASKEEIKSKSSTQIAQNSSQIQPQSHQQNLNVQQSNENEKKGSSSSKKSKKEKKSHDKDKDRESRKDKESKSQKEFDHASRSSSTVSYQGSSAAATVAPNISSSVELGKIHKQDINTVKPSSKSKAEHKLATELSNILPTSNTASSSSASKKTSEKHENEEKRHKHKKKDKTKDKDKEKIREKECSSSKDKDKKKDKKTNKDDTKRNKDEDVGSNATSSSNLGPAESLHESLFNSDHESRHSEVDKLIHHSDSSNHTFVGNVNKTKTSQNNANTTPKQHLKAVTPTPQVYMNDNTSTTTEKKEKKIKDQKLEKEEKKRKRKSREGTADLSTLSAGITVQNSSESQPKISKKTVVELKPQEKQSPSLQQQIILQQPLPIQPPTDSFRTPSVSSGSSISCSSVPIAHHTTGVSRTNLNSGNTGNSGFDLDYISELKELQEKIMTLQDNNELQKVVEIIAATGRFEITNKTFDFDLCALDRNTIQRLHVIV